MKEIFIYIFDVNGDLGIEFAATCLGDLTSEGALT